MIRLNQFSPVKPTVRPGSTKYNSFSRVITKVKTGQPQRVSCFQNRTAKQTFFGDNYFESGTQIIIKKTEIAGLTPLSANTAESLFAGIMNNTFFGSFQAINIKYLYGGASLDNGIKNTTYWFQVMDQPIDLFGRIDTSSPILIEGL
ncbi:hypothetical protein LC613_13770 [Nostoc sphaeroides CHAB 2801]|uniref:hypothetical protein n=1 Tax=Nostoc sphaeroides TaxID=446679 RepID=UPI000E4EF283|nr:hypothetical protein [Nostoc sphaeroides]MCC5629084.1 hypothetical protein [Nostoc sphaeroides CHAB 2801]